MSPVHLRVVELERNRQRPFPQTPSVLAPNQKRIIEHAAIHTYSPVYLVLRERGSANNHAIRQVMIFATLGHLPRQPQVIGIKLLQITGERNITGTNLTFPIRHDGTNSQLIILHQLPPDRKHIKLFHAACRPPDTPAHQHIKLQPSPPTDTHKATDIHRLEKSKHRHRRVHPHLERVGTGRFLGINFFHATFHFKLNTRKSKPTNRHKIKNQGISLWF